MEVSPCYFETLINCFFHPFKVCFVSQLKRCSTSHSASWSWVARSLRRSIPIELSCSFILVLGEDLRSKDAKINMTQGVDIFKKGSRIKKIMLACVPLSPYLTTWISGRDSCLVGVSCHYPRIPEWNSCICTHASWPKFLKVELRFVETLRNQFKNNQHLILIKWVQGNVPVTLRKYW